MLLIFLPKRSDTSDSADASYTAFFTHSSYVLFNSVFAQWLPNLWYQHSRKSGSHSYINSISQYIHILQWNSDIALELTLTYIAT